MPSDRDMELAYAAGQAAGADGVGIAGCPFAVDAPEREAWLRGAVNAFEDRANIQREVRDALELNDRGA